MIRGHWRIRLMLTVELALATLTAVIGVDVATAGFAEFQSIPTNWGHDWEFFTIGSDSYLAVANNNNGSTWSIDSKIYIWNGVNFVEYQSIPTSGANDWEFFTIGSDSYLALACNYDGSTYNCDSIIYKWNGTSFVEYQSIPTSDAQDFEFFNVGVDPYLAVANFTNNGGSYNVDSKVYKWNGTSFVEYQTVPTSGAHDCLCFTIGSETYLSLANYHNDSTRHIDSKVYRWNGMNFVEFQAISTVGAVDWECFVIGGESYLCVANHRSDSTWNTESKIYKWNGSSFVEFQTIVTSGAHDWEFFAIGSECYVAVCNYRDDSGMNVDSKVYRWNGSSFVEYQAIPTSGAVVWKYSPVGEDSYLAVANYQNGSTGNIDSKIYLFENGTVPVEIVSIEATPIDEDVLIEWSVTGPSDLGDFFVHRSSSGARGEYLLLTLEPVGEIVYGNRNYSYLDVDVIPGTLYHYKLEAIEPGGESVFFGPYPVLARGRKAQYFLAQSTPNPFRRGSETTIRYSIAEAGRVQIRILDVAGRLVRTITEDARLGDNQIRWNCTDQKGRQVPSGVYFYQLRAGAFVSQRKMLVVD